MLLATLVIVVSNVFTPVAAFPAPVANSLAPSCNSFKSSFLAETLSATSSITFNEATASDKELTFSVVFVRTFAALFASVTP